MNISAILWMNISMVLQMLISIVLNRSAVLWINFSAFAITLTFAFERTTLFKERVVFNFCSILESFMFGSCKIHSQSRVPFEAV